MCRTLRARTVCAHTHAIGNARDQGRRGTGVGGEGGECEGTVCCCPSPYEARPWRRRAYGAGARAHLHERHFRKLVHKNASTRARGRRGQKRFRLCACARITRPREDTRQILVGGAGGSMCTQGFNSRNASKMQRTQKASLVVTCAKRRDGVEAGLREWLSWSCASKNAHALSLFAMTRTSWTCRSQALLSLQCVRCCVWQQPDRACVLSTTATVVRGWATSAAYVNE